ncbi:MAG TPA: chitobiase/beta-hexosaminidase C-terminal domain-containing protein, partial [Verrucomicrobiae bacterium]|nr:chitobiase/beta-hexosaminidase C-terminal domain-containing protein [Verrucomicrobiae bacterium]
VGISGYTTNLYGVASNLWWSGTTGSGGTAWIGWSDGPVWQPDTVGDVQARLPFGVAVGSDGTVYTTEDYYHIVREVTGANIAPPPPPPPSQPVITAVTTNYGQVNLSWAPVTGATGYNVKRSPSSGGTYTTLASIASTTYTDTNVINGTTYYYVVSAFNAGGESTNSAEVSATPPLPPVPDPQIGYVTFPPPDFTSVFTPGTPAGQTFNNDVPIVIIGTDVSQTFYTYGNTTVFTNLPDPTPASSSAPQGYHDGLSSIAGLTVAQVLPNLAIKAVGHQSGHPDSATVSALFQFVVANPNLYGNNAAQFSVSNITVGAKMYYTTDGSTPDPTNPAAIGPISSGQTLSLNFGASSNLLLMVRGFKDSYQPSGIVSNLFSKADFVANSISFGSAYGEPSSKFIARPGQFYYAPVTLNLLPNFTKMYSLQFNVAVTNGLASPPIYNGAGIDFFSMLMSKVKPDEGLYFPPADGNWYLPIPGLIPVLNGTATNWAPSAFVNTNNNLLGVGWLYRTGIKYLATDTNGQVFLDFDTSAQDLTAFSIAHDTLFTEGNGKVVVGAYSFQVPKTANVGDKYFIQIGNPSATSDGVGAPGASIYIQPPATNQVVTVGSPVYLVGDVAPFHWFNAGDFGNSNLDNSDVMQVYQAAILGVNMPPANSDLYAAMDSSGMFGVLDADPADPLYNTYTNISSALTPTEQTALFDGNDQTINTNIFGDGVLDVSDLYVTFRRSLDPSLTWYNRFWIQNQIVGVPTPNLAYNTNIPSAYLAKSTVQPSVKTGASQQPFVTFTAGDAQASAGQVVQIPITANIVGNYPLCVLGLNLTVYPLDGSPALTQPVQFTPAPGLGAPTPGFTTVKGDSTYAAAWLNNSITGLTGNATIGTLTVTLPANATSLSAYAVHFNVASGSPNGLGVFSKRTLTGLITTSSRTNSTYNDGIPDSWRLRWFGTIYNLLSVSNACPSGDGVNNWQKYVAGVDPNTPNDFPNVNAKSSVPPGATAAIHWPTISGKQYVVLRSDSLFSGSWTPVSTNTGTGTDMEYDDYSTGTAKFYRVLILP